MTSIRPILLGTLVATATLASTVRPQCGLVGEPGEHFPGVVGVVRAATWWDPDGAGPAPRRLVIGGGFAVAFGVVANNVAAYDPGTGEWSNLGNGLPATVRALAVSSNGDLVAASGGVWRFDGVSWQPLGNALTSGGVHALLPMPGGELLAGGSFDDLGGVPARAIARWNGSAWSEFGGGLAHPAATVFALARLHNGDVVAGGHLESFLTPSFAIQRFDGSTWQTMGGGLNGAVAAMVTMPSGDLVVGGGFSMAGGVQAPGTALWNGQNWVGIGSMGAESLAFTVLQNGDLYAAGKIRSGIWDGTSWTSVPNVLWWIYAVAELPNGDLFAGGTTSSQSADFYAVGRFDGVQWTPFARGTGLDRQTTAAVAMPDGGWVVGGDFESIRGQPLSHIAYFRDGTWSPLGGGLDAAPRALLRHSDGTVFAAGAFRMAGNAPANRIAHWDGTQWSPLGQGVDGTVHALVELPDGDVLAGGEFFNADGSWAPFVARWDGASWSNLGSWPSWYVYALEVMPNGDVVAGGRFQTAGGNSCRNVARWNGTTWGALGTGVDRDVRAVAALRDGGVVAGGDFLNAGGQPANFVAQWDGAAWSPMGSGMGQPLRALTVLPDGDVVAAGRLFGSFTQPRCHPARWDGSAWSDLDLGGETGIEVLDVAWGDRGELAFCGAFFEAGAEFSAYFGRLSTPCAADRIVLPTACVGPAGPLTLSAAERPWGGRPFTATATGFANGSLAVALLGLTSPDVPLTWLWANTLPSCNQLASQEAILLTLPQAGAARFSFDVPDSTAYVGLPLYHQFLQFEVGAGNTLLTLSASNALALTIGVF